VYLSGEGLGDLLSVSIYDHPQTRGGEDEKGMHMENRVFEREGMRYQDDDK
jgi:hypothetical protein